MTEPSSQPSAPAGYFALLAALLANTDANNLFNSRDIFQLTEGVAKQQQNNSNAWIDKLKEDQAAVTAEVNNKDHSDSQKSIKLQELTSGFQVDNTSYNAANTTFTAMISGLQNTSSAMSQTVSLNYQMMQTSVLFLQQQLVKDL